MHAALDFGDSPLYLVDEFPECGGTSPQSLGGSPVTLDLHVPDCDALYERAVAAGCTVVMPLEDMFWGDRYGMVADPYGHRWSIATTKRHVGPDELQEAVARF
jgi:PhnB protein